MIDTVDLFDLLDQAQADVREARFLIQAFAQPNSIPRVERLQERAIEWLERHGYCPICCDYRHPTDKHAVEVKE